MTTPITGGCACGAIRYECAVEPVMMLKCHCRDCQRVSGGGFACAVLFPANSFKLTRGTPKYHRARRYSDAELGTMFVSREKPYYPLALRQRGIPGSGVFRLYIDEQGRVTKIGVLASTGNKELDASAMKAIVHWRAKPGAKREVDQPCTFTKTR